MGGQLDRNFSRVERTRICRVLVYEVVTSMVASNVLEGSGKGME